VTANGASAAPAYRDLLGDLLGDLRAEQSGEVLADSYSLRLYASDASMYAVEPLAVVTPRSADDVAAVVTLAAGANVPVLARGAGTSLAGQTVGRAVILDFSQHMDRILECNGEARIARVQPGVVQDQLNVTAGQHGLMFGADTSTSNRATLGGMIGNNSSGTHSIVHGTTVDHVCSLHTVLSDGTLASLGPVGDDELARRAQFKTLEGRLYRELPGIALRHRGAIERDDPPMWRHSGGYRLDRVLRTQPGLDLARFIVGSEGTLALVTEAELKLVARPAAQGMAVGHFRSTREAIAATAEALEMNAAAIELMDSTILELARSKHEFAALSQILEGRPAALLFVTFFGDSDSEVADQVDRLAATWHRHGHGYHTLPALSAADRAAVLKVRKASLGLLMAASRGTRRPLAFVEDTAVPPERLEEYVERFEAVLTRHSLTAGFYGHCSVGCLHIRPFVDVRQPSQVASMRAVAEEILALVIEFGGVNSSEHGDGLARSEFNARLFGAELYQAMRQVKQLFDPDGRLNPGKIVDAAPMTDSLRDVALTTAGPLATRIDFSEQGGMRAAADRCMNIGACRKSGEGTMCPSYQATRREEHATRGRANALVKALSEPDPHQALGDERLHEILDLCLECKACKSECPLSVDMASLKSEALAHYQDIHGVPWRARAFGRIRDLNRIGAATAPLSNLAVRSRPLRALLERRLGITSRRPLPQFERETLMRWDRRRPPASTAAPRGSVVFLADSFTSYTETRVPQAAIELLEIAGWRVTIESRGCCGRSSLSKGLLDDATAMATDMVGRLAPHAQAGSRIVGCEPSCLLTLRDEYLQLLPSDPRARLVADQTTAPAELLLEAVRDGALRFAPASPGTNRRIVVHPHCHEKAVTGTAATVQLLRQIPGADVVELDAGCCGMAGSFGFETEHYGLSREIGELRLAPAVRAQPADALVAATGVSCRQQIRHLAERQAWHPLELVRQAVA
jgi:FAD/FMN-containing dehydrogenase/Fe-S oxidoreductase